MRMRSNHVIAVVPLAVFGRGINRLYSSSADMADDKPGRRSPHSPRQGKRCKYAPTDNSGLDMGATRFSPLSDSYDMYIESVEPEKSYIQCFERATLAFQAH